MTAFDAKMPITAAGLNKTTLETVRHRFMSFNDARLQRAKSVLNPHQQVFLESLPLLLHVNHPLLPGYISMTTPAGVACFEPDKYHIRAAKSLANSFIYTPRDEPPSIENISVMGSIGSVAYSRASDMDFWICHNPSLTPTALAELECKLDRIQRWAEGLGLEIYFFLMDADQFRQGQRKGVSSEDCGSAQHYLLLDEYYRTGLIVAGKPPAWWMVPATQEARYDDTLKKMIGQKLISLNDYIDFGGIPVFPAGEFIGAGMWQLYKGIESPYKSVIKIMLTEVYASEYPEVEGLSMIFKKSIYSGQADIDKLDPYIMLYRKIENYLSASDQVDRLELLRKSFYLKVNETLSKPSTGRTRSWKREVLEELIGTWSWSEKKMALLDNRKNWKVREVIDQRKLVVDELNTSYRFLSRFAKENGFSALINNQDMSLLGRKLYAAFERKSGKIEHVNPNIAPSIVEETVSIKREYVTERDGIKTGRWALYSSLEGQYQNQEKSLKFSRSLVEILTWCYFNGVVNSHTRIAFNPGETALSEKEIRLVLSTFDSLYPHRLAMAEQSAFEQAAKPLDLTFFVNIGVDPMVGINRKGYRRITAQSDPLNFSGLHQSLIKSIDKVSQNSWHEVSVEHFSSDTCVADALLDYMHTCPPGKLPKMPKISILCGSEERNELICTRLQTVFEAMVDTYYSGSFPLTSRFVLNISSHYYVFQFMNNHPVVRVAKSYKALLKLLGEVQPKFAPVVFEEGCLKGDPLPLISKENADNKVQVFIKKVKEQTTFYVYDEKGALFVFEQQNLSDKAFLYNLDRFFSTVQNRQTNFMDLSEDKSGHFSVSYYLIVGSSQVSLEKLEVVRGVDIHAFHEVRVIIEREEDGRNTYKIEYDGKEFSEARYGAELFSAVVQAVAEKNKYAAQQAIVVTDMECPEMYLEHGGVQTVTLLEKKRAIEVRLNRLLDSQ